MKIYLLCTLDSEHYREPYFYFFEAAFAAHKWVIDNLVSITEESREEVISELEYKNVDGSDDQIMRIDYSFGDGEFYVYTIHEIEIEDGDYLCIYHHAYEGVGFYVEKIGTLEECKNHMLDSAAKICTNLFGESQRIKQLDISYNTNKNKGIKLQYFLIGVIARTIIEWMFR